MRPENGVLKARKAGANECAVTVPPLQFTPYLLPLLLWSCGRSLGEKQIQLRPGRGGPSTTGGSVMPVTHASATGGRRFVVQFPATAYNVDTDVNENC